VFTAARVGLVDYDVALELARYLTQEDDQTPWKAFSMNVQYIDDMLINSQYYTHWQVGSLATVYRSRNPNIWSYGLLIVKLSHYKSLVHYNRIRPLHKSARISQCCTLPHFAH